MFTKSKQIESPTHQLMEMGQPHDTLKASKTPIKDLHRLSFAGRKANRWQYMAGLESYFSAMPRISDNDSFYEEKRLAIIEIFKDVKNRVIAANLGNMSMDENDFARTFLALEEPMLEDGQLNGGPSLIVTRWSKGLQLPIHSHAAGFMYEEMIDGKFIDTDWRVVDTKFLIDGTITNIVRPIRTTIFTNGMVLSDMYTNHCDKNKYPALIHSLYVAQESIALHLVPQTPRDTRGNTHYTEQHFSSIYNLNKSNVEKVWLSDIQNLSIGEVLLVRRGHNTDLNDHYEIVTGGIPAIVTYGHKYSAVLDGYNNDRNMSIAVQLNEGMRDAFLKFHGIKIKDGRYLIFPEE